MAKSGRKVLLTVALVVILCAGILPGIGTSNAQASEFWGVSKIYFPQTGHHLSGDFLTAWQANGGLYTFGYPISEPEKIDGRTVQYFERARLELHGEHAGTRYVVQASLLGNWIAEDRRDESAFKPLPADGMGEDTTSRRYFEATGHTLAYGFKSYWEQNGGLYVFGMPISEEFQELNRDTGEVHTVQYFERARFEWHPENRGTRYEILLGRLGAEFADNNDIDQTRVDRASDAIGAFPGLLDPNWSRATRTPQGDVIGVVNADQLNVRSAPSVTAPVVSTTYKRHPVTIKEMVPGDAVDNIEAWYRIGADRYIAAAWVDPFVASAPAHMRTGRWLDVNLNNFYAVAYEDGQAVYAAIITAGRDGKTPRGTFQVQRRVYSETMDAATVGISPNDPDYYYLEDVHFTQYFRSGGYAVHENYWTHPSAYGRFSSNGCVGLMYKDAEWMWNFLSIGSTIDIHG